MGENQQQDFENWMLSFEHPVIGWITSQWFERGDCSTTYSNDYVQGAWVVFKMRAAPTTVEPELSLGERMKAAGMISLDELLSGSPLDAFMVHNGVHNLDTFGQWLEMKRREYVTLQARFTLDKREEDELFEWVLAHAAVFGEVMINFRAARSQPRNSSAV